VTWRLDVVLWVASLFLSQYGKYRQVGKSFNSRTVGRNGSWIMVRFYSIMRLYLSIRSLLTSLQLHIHIYRMLLFFVSYTSAVYGMILMAWLHLQHLTVSSYGDENFIGRHCCPSRSQVVYSSDSFLLSVCFSSEVSHIQEGHPRIMQYGTRCLFQMIQSAVPCFFDCCACWNWSELCATCLHIWHAGVSCYNSHCDAIVIYYY